MWMDVLVLSAMFPMCCPSFLGSRLFARPEARCQQVQTWSSEQDIAVLAHYSSNGALDRLTRGTHADDACPIARRSQLVPLAWQQFCTNTYQSIDPHHSKGSPPLCVTHSLTSNNIQDYLHQSLPTYTPAPMHYLSTQPESEIGTSTHP